MGKGAVSPILYISYILSQEISLFSSDVCKVHVACIRFAM